MRLLVVGVALLFTTTAAAQSRWTLSAGPEWGWWNQSANARMWSARVRAEYDLTRPGSVFGLRFETGLRWGPNQNYFYESGTSFASAAGQETDFIFGITGALSPLPGKRFSPYVAMGLFGRQVWSRGSSSFRDPAFGSSGGPYSATRGDVIGTLGLGLRTRLGGRSFQLELRQIYNHYSLTFGTRLPF